MNYKKLKACTWVVVVSVSLFTVVGSVCYADISAKPRVDIENLFTPSGSMGDGEYGRKYIVFNDADHTNPHSATSCIRVTYKFGPNRWAGIYWQNQPDNWGKKPGNNYSGKGYSKITFWARGALGGEVVEFKAGGIDSPMEKFRDSFAGSTGRIALSKEWKQYQIDIANMDISSVIGGFCWVASADYNSGVEMTFYLDDMIME